MINYNIVIIMEKKVSEQLKSQIVKDLVEPLYISDIKTAIDGKKCWKITGQIFETVSKILVAGGTVVSFASGYFENPVLGFVAGSITTISLAMLQFASFAYAENKKRTVELNGLLEKLDIDTIPELDRTSDHMSEHVNETSNILRQQQTQFIPAIDVVTTNTTPHQPITSDHSV